MIIRCLVAIYFLAVIRLLWHNDEVIYDVIQQKTQGLSGAFVGHENHITIYGNV